MLYEKGPNGEKCHIYLGLSSSVIASGLRETIRYLCQHNLVGTIVTTGRAIEMDIMKCFKSFRVGNF